MRQHNIWCVCVCFVWRGMLDCRGLWGLDGVGSGWGQVAGTCEYGDELSGSKNAGNFLTSCRTS